MFRLAGQAELDLRIERAKKTKQIDGLSWGPEHHGVPVKVVYRSGMLAVVCGHCNIVIQGFAVAPFSEDMMVPDAPNG